MYSDCFGKRGERLFFVITKRILRAIILQFLNFCVMLRRRFPFIFVELRLGFKYRCLSFSLKVKILEDKALSKATVNL